MSKCKDCKNPRKTFFGNDQGFSMPLCKGLGCPATDDVPGSTWSAPSTHAGLPGPVEQPQSSNGPWEAPERSCPKCNSLMIGEARSWADVGPSYYYLCRKCNYGFTTAMVNTGRPMTVQERRLAGIDSAAFIKKSKSITALHTKLFPPEGTPQIREELSRLFPYPTPEEIAAKSKPAKPVEEVLEKARSLRRTIHKMEEDRRALEKQEFDARTEPILKIARALKSERERQERDARVIRPDNARYGKNGRLESAGRK